MRYYISSPTMNPLSRFVAAILVASAMVAMFFFGLIILVVLFAVFSLFALGMWLRAWWLGRRLTDATLVRTEGLPDGNEIDAEYTVVSRRRS